DYVNLARVRRLPLTDAALWKKSVATLEAEMQPIDHKEEQELRKVQILREDFESKHKKITVEKLRDMMRSAGITCSSGITRGGMIDRLVNTPPPENIILDPDQEALIKRCAAKRTLVYAGPGAGKTTTLSYVAKAIITADSS